MNAPDYRFQRLSTIMSPDPGDPMEFWGAFNPTVGRAPDGRWHLLARVTAEGNVSRVRMAELEFRDGVPAGVRRLEHGGAPAGAVWRPVGAPT